MSSHALYIESTPPPGWPSLLVIQPLFGGDIVAHILLQTWGHIEPNTSVISWCFIVLLSWKYYKFVCIDLIRLYVYFINHNSQSSTNLVNGFHADCSVKSHISHNEYLPICRKQTLYCDILIRVAESRDI